MDDARGAHGLVGAVHELLAGCVGLPLERAECGSSSTSIALS